MADKVLRGTVLPSRLFFLVAVAELVFAQVYIVTTSRRSYDHTPDLGIYREVGQLMVHGIDPYDFKANAEKREQLRSDTYGMSPAPDVALYNYYVSGNLPGSTLFYGLIERLTGGDTLGWRLALAAGNLAILLASCFFLARVRVGIDRLPAQIALVLSVVLYPSLLYWGTLFSEDKQIQIALMIALAAFVVAPGNRPRVEVFLIGVLFSLSLLFKAFGFFLAPVLARYFAGRPWRELAIAVFGAAVIGIPIVLYFDFAFVELILNRLRSSGGLLAAGGIHASPWSLLPAASTIYLRPVLCLLLMGGTVHAYRVGRIDLLNCSAAFSVVFVCLWMRDGSMDRLNIAMIFALICTATLSVRVWLFLATINFVIQVPLYVLMTQRWQVNHGLPFEALDAVAVAVFVILYFSTLLLPQGLYRIRKDQPVRASPPEA